MNSTPKKLKNYQLQASHGFGTLFIVIILGGVALSIALWVSTSSLWSMRESIDNTTSAQTKALGNACAEVALEMMRENNSYVGTNNVTINGAVCTYTVINTGGNSRSITISGSTGAITRKLQITTSAFNPLTIASWQEN